MDLKDYKLPEQKKAITKHQSLALEIIAYCKIEKKMQGRWFRICKKRFQFIEKKFADFKEMGKTEPSYLWRMIYPKK